MHSIKTKKMTCKLKKIKETVRKLQNLKLPLDIDYLIIESNGCELGWGALLKIIHQEKGLRSSIDQEILAVNYVLDSFQLFLLNKKEILVRTDYVIIVKFFNNKNNKRIS